ncbi:hypothetical protein CLOSCI_03820 [[Clostridium] scindens ATCC 35704]|nr:hypothetical protein CLOSCI_03820 [[Clostridium] scindens ATCC 35704]
MCYHLGITVQIDIPRCRRFFNDCFSPADVVRLIAEDQQFLP